MFTRLRFKKPQFTNEPRNDFERLSKSIYDYLFGLESPGVIELTEARGDFNSLSIGTHGLSHKNRLIGGDFTTNPWNRGTTFAAAADGTYTADRFVWNQSGAGVVTVQRTANAPTADEAKHYATHCLEVDVTTADASLAAGDIYTVSQKVEGLNAASFGFGQSQSGYVTLSFWAYSTKTGTHCVSLRNSAANRAYVGEYTVFASNTWEKKTVTIPVDTSGTWLYDTGTGVTVTWCLAAGTNYQTTAGAWAAGNYVASANQVNCMDSTSNSFRIALCRLEPGKVATQFEWRPRTTEELLCARYCPSFTGIGAIAAGHAYSTTNALVEFVFIVPPRVAPTGITATAGNYSLWDGVGGLIACNTIGLYGGSAGLRSATIAPTVAAGLTAGRGTQLVGAISGAMIFTGCEL